MKQIFGTVVVLFHSYCSKAEIDAYLEQESLDGTKVSNLGNRYAIEVPAGREQEYVEKFSATNIIKSVNPNFIRGLKERHND